MENKNISQETLQKLEKSYRKSTLNKVAENAIIKNGIYESSINHDAVQKHNFEFSIETKIGAITNQKIQEDVEFLLQLIW